MAQAAAEFPSKFVDEASEDIVDALEERLEADTGGDNSLSRAPAELSVDVDISGGGSTVTAEIRPAGGQGQWTWLEEGTMPHEQPSRGWHPGASPNETWTGGSAREVRGLTRKGDAAFTEVFGG